MQAEIPTLADYLAVFRRRKLAMLSVAALVAALGVAVAVLLPSVYQAGAVIRVEKQAIPDDIVRTTVNTYVDEQLEIVRKRVVTRANVENIIRKFKLYEDEWETEGIDALVERTIANVSIEPQSARFPDSRTGRTVILTIAFNLLHSAEDPSVAQTVANALAELFLEENTASRTEMAAETAAFLTEQAEDLRSHIAELEKKIAAFKEEHKGRLPELSGLNLQLMERTERELRDTQDRIRLLKQQEIQTQGDLTLVSPSAPTVGLDGRPVLTPPERLNALQAEYASKSAVYSAEHPDLVRMRREIESLTAQLGGSGGGADALRTQLAVERDRLAALRERYSAEHPDVKKLSRTVSTLEAQLKEAATANPAAAILAAPANNPTYIQLKSRLEATATELRMHEAREAQLRAKLQEIEARLTAIPEVEREYRALVREHEGAVEEYNNIRAKQRQAKLAQRLESTDQGERYTLVQSATLPRVPVWPPRLIIAVFGCIFGGAFGIGTGALLEALDRTVHGAKAVVSLVQAPVLAVIPYIENSRDRRRRSLRRALSGAAVTATIIGGVSFFHFKVAPIDSIWSDTVEQAELESPVSGD